MKKNLMSLAIAGVLGFGVATASAEDAFEGSWYLVPGVSYMNSDSDLDADNGAGGFLKFGKELSQHWDVQIGAGHTRVDEDLNIAGAGGKYKQTLLGVDALYMFSRDKFRPFLVAGLGLARNNLDYDINGLDIGDKKTSWMANVGLGAQYFFNDRVGLQADLRHVWSRADLGSNARAFGLSDPGTVGNTYFNLGGIIKFGAPKPAVAEAPAPEPVMAAAPEPTPAPVLKECKPKVERFLLSSEILFGFDKDKLRPEGLQVLDNEVIPKIKSEPFEVVFVTGHTDLLGSFEYNDALSIRRAEAVKSYLISQGVDAGIISAYGAGESTPIELCSESLPRKQLIECLQPNRRVEIEANRSDVKACE
ncbi:MAG: OmpA family protein [Methylophilaceae bacterium]|nr:OmpA family protein [Methylophilaceae bacterium]